jgi:pyruvate formate lyase activating enzyme
MYPLFLKYDKYIECRLCPHMCKIPEGKRGICGARKNTGDKIELLTYGVISGYALDPVEKKPLYHFFPGRKILSIGSFGCNMRCDFCQNWHISQRSADSFSPDTGIAKIVNDSLSSEENIGIAFTYNEPVIWFEFMRDVAVKIKEKGLYTAIVSNGFINKDPLLELTSFIDAFNIDLKAFNDNFYRKLTGADIGPVKESLKLIAREGKHLEITTLIIPGKNDDPAEMEMEAKWISDELGSSVPLHLSRYYPMFKRDDPATPQSTLDHLYDIATRYLKNVYMGNTVSEHGQETRCNKCGTILTKRSGYNTRLLNLDDEGKCVRCGALAYKYFSFSSPIKR